MATKSTRTPMSDEHKAALAEGRNQGRSVRRYLEALDAHRPKRGRKRTPESVQKRLVRIEADLAAASLSSCQSELNGEPCDSDRKSVV